MKAFVISDQITQFHWAMLKSVVLILTVLPMIQGALILWQHTEGSSQIMVGFVSLSIVTAWSVVCFLKALKATLWQCRGLLHTEQVVFKLYRYVPMLFLSSLAAYLATQVTVLF